MMLHSMTGFAQQGTALPWGEIAWEIRTVNHRHLDIHLHLPENARAIETEARHIIRDYLGRGRIDCTLHLQPSAAKTIQQQLNLTVLNEIIQHVQQLSSMGLPLADADPLSILRWPQLLTTPALSAEQISSLLTLLETTLRLLQTTRAHEGSTIRSFLQDKLERLNEHYSLLCNYDSDRGQHKHDELLRLAAQLQCELQPERFEQEILYYLQKYDVAEELHRLTTHLDSFAKLLDESAPGRKMDVLLQEILRETNTLSAKAHHLAMIQSTMDMKVLIEQMREQVQNIE